MCRCNKRSHSLPPTEKWWGQQRWVVNNFMENCNQPKSHNHVTTANIIYTSHNNVSVFHSVNVLTWSDGRYVRPSVLLPIIESTAMAIKCILLHAVIKAVNHLHVHFWPINNKLFILKVTKWILNDSIPNGKIERVAKNINRSVWMKVRDQAERLQYQSFRPPSHATALLCYYLLPWPLTLVPRILWSHSRAFCF